MNIRFTKRTTLKVLLIITLSFILYAVQVYAENSVINEYDLTLLHEGGFPEYIFSEEEYVDIRSKIHSGLAQRDEMITVNIPEFTTEHVAQLYESEINTSPELYYVIGHVEIEQSSDNEYSIYPQYETDIELMANSMNQAVDDILAQVNSNMTDAEKILAVHDYILLHYEYDLTYSIYDPETFFIRKKGVCQAYAEAFEYIMDKLNIPCTAISSRSMDHAWNMVKIDGEWYHVDVTWDDPVTDTYGQACHKYLLLNDSTISDDQHNHYGWISSHKATSTKYADYFWTELWKPMYYINGEWYFASNYGSSYYSGGINKYSFKTNTITNILESYNIECFGVYSGYTYLLVGGGNIYTSPINDIKNISKITKIDINYDNWDGAYFENGYLYYALADEKYYQITEDLEPVYSDYYKYRYFHSVDLRSIPKNTLKWSYADNALTVDCNGELPNYRDICSPWEEYKSEIRYLRLGDKITSIDSYSFYSYPALKYIIFPASLETIESYAFGGCSNLKSIIIPDSVISIGGYAFA